MMSQVRSEPPPELPEFNYHLLRNSLNTFSKNLQQLQNDEYQQVYRSATKSFELENLVLESKEANSFVVSPEQIDEALQSIVDRYPDRDEFIEDMNNNGLDEASLRTALYRELTFDGVMQIVGSRTVSINDLDIRLFYEMHLDKFEKPETRFARHILITVNDDFEENRADAARRAIDEIAEKLNGRSNRFPQFAKRHSECPTAMEGGKLGDIVRGQLFPELDEALFAMQEGEISNVIETEIGFHILLCEKIKPAKRVPLSQAAERIRTILQQRNERNCQKSWLQELKAAKQAGT